MKKKKEKIYKKHIWEATRFRSPSRFTKETETIQPRKRDGKKKTKTGPKIPQYARWFRSESTKILQNQHHMSIHLQTDQATTSKKKKKKKNLSVPQKKNYFERKKSIIYRIWKKPTCIINSITQKNNNNNKKKKNNDRNSNGRR